MSYALPFLLAAVGVWSAGADAGAGVKVGSFNLDTFGPTKFSKEEAVAVLVKIVLRYDVIFLMEIRDSSETIIYSFLDKVNSAAGDGVTFDLKLSQRLGRTSRKEQYAYLYRTDRVEVLKTFQFSEDDGGDVFDRDPYGILIRSTMYRGMSPFFLLGLRAQYDSVSSELNQMDEVYDAAALYYGTERGVILGDLGADCGYLSRSAYDGLDLVRDVWFKWMIGPDQDTTTSTKSDCAYDRIIVGPSLSGDVSDASVEIFHHDTEYGLSLDEALEVSDRYAVGVVITAPPLLFHDVVRRQAEGVGGLKLASFNIQVFGVSKFAKEEVVAVLSQIVRRYDITFIQEIRDVSETVIYDFLDRVNRDAEADGVTFNLSVSARLGRTNSKEQYAYLYRMDTISVSPPFQYIDTEDDIFEREPYSVRITSLTLDIPPFILVGIHISPGSVTPEMNQMDEVYAQATEALGTGDGMILGDLNADCSYLSMRRYLELNLVTSGQFTWLIGNTVDTTTKASDCAYDRFITAGNLGNYIVNNTAQPFRYDQAYGLSQELTENVSDHYPIEVLLQGDLRTTGLALSTTSSIVATDSASPLGGHTLLTIICITIATEYYGHLI